MGAKKFFILKVRPKILKITQKLGLKWRSPQENFCLFWHGITKKCLKGGRFFNMSLSKISKFYLKVGGVIEEEKAYNVHIQLIFFCIHIISVLIILQCKLKISLQRRCQKCVSGNGDSNILTRWRLELFRAVTVTVTVTEKFSSGDGDGD